MMANRNEIKTTPMQKNAMSLNNGKEYTYIYYIYNTNTDWIYKEMGKYTFDI